MHDCVRDRARELLRLHSSGEICWKTFIDDRKWGMKMCLWMQHHKHDPRHKNLGRPFWSVAAYREWRSNISSLPVSEVKNNRDQFKERTLKKLRDGKLRAFLRHEHVVPKNEMIKWLLNEPENVDCIFDKNLCCVITLDEDRRLPRDTHPNPRDPWLRYRDRGIEVLFNPDWPEEVVSDLWRHRLLDDNEP